ncbi:MAG: hypothetical protein HFH35_10555 [Eubacterium sp.]|nr:hypothetical protein [Eubacterium sp.]
MAVINVAPYIPIYVQEMMEKRNWDKILQDLAPYADRMELALSRKILMVCCLFSGIRVSNWKIIGSLAVKK